MSRESHNYSCLLFVIGAVVIAGLPVSAWWYLALIAACLFL